MCSCQPSEKEAKFRVNEAEDFFLSKDHFHRNFRSELKKNFEKIHIYFKMGMQGLSLSSLKKNPAVSFRKVWKIHQRTRRK